MRKGRCVKDPYGKFGDKDFEDYDAWKYKRYARLIGRIISENKRKTGYGISRKDFDHLLWYYFKGNDDRIERARDCIAEDRLEESRNKFINSTNYED